MKSLIILFICAAVCSVNAQVKPNILWLITDDQRADSVAAFNRATTGSSQSALGYVSSPNLDRFASEGVLFTRAYCNSPGCAPSRSSMITGRYPHRNGMYGFTRAHDQPDFARPVIPQIMKSLGYSTATIGKSGYYIFDWNNGLTWNNAGFYDFDLGQRPDFWNQEKTDFYTSRVWQDGSSRRFSNFLFEDGREIRFEESTPTAADRALKQQVVDELDLLYSYTRQDTTLIIGGQSPKGVDGTLDAFIAQAFLDRLQSLENSNASTPSFTHLGFHFPHTPVLPPKVFRDRFINRNYQIPAFNRSQELGALPAQLVDLFNKTNFADMTWAEKQQAIRDYYAFCAYGDSLIGKTVDQFKQHSEAQGRPWLCLIVCGDHGWHLGEQGIEAKFGPYDKSNRCTVIALSSDKNRFPAGKVYDDFVEFVDFGPTMLSAAGLDLNSSAAEHLDGLNLSELVSGAIPPRDYAIGEMNHVIGPRSYMRTKRFAFSMRTRPNNGEIGAGTPGENVRWGLDTGINNVQPALFDLSVDPGERFNVAGDPAYAAIVNAFRNKLARIVLGDGRIECKWRERNTFTRSTFALGAHDHQFSLAPSALPNSPPVISMAGVAPDAVLNTGTDVGLTVTVSDPDAGDRVEEVSLYLNGVLVRTMTSAPYEWGLTNLSEADPSLTGLQNGSYTLRVVAKDQQGAEADLVRYFTVRPIIPDYWNNSYIGTGTAQSAFEYNGSAYEMRGVRSGDIAGRNDSFSFHHRGISDADGLLITRVTSMTSNQADSKAGLMYRATTGTQPSNCFLGVTKSNGLVWQHRRGGGNPTTIVRVPGVSAPVWLKLYRRGRFVFPSYSQDGQRWTDLPYAKVPTGVYYFSGLAASSFVSSSPLTASFENVTNRPLERGFSGWAAAYFGENHKAIPQTAAPGADLDSDQLPNLMEYILQGDPTKVGDAPLLKESNIDNDQFVLVLNEYHSMENVEREFEVSDTLDQQDWEPVTPESVTATLVEDDFYSRVEASFQAPAGGAPLRFIRVKYTLTE